MSSTGIPTLRVCLDRWVFEPVEPCTPNESMSVRCEHNTCIGTTNSFQGRMFLFNQLISLTTLSSRRHQRLTVLLQTRTLVKYLT
jgi:hypothetical protein